MRAGDGFGPCVMERRRSIFVSVDFGPRWLADHFLECARTEHGRLCGRRSYIVGEDLYTALLPRLGHDQELCQLMNNRF